MGNIPYSNPTKSLLFSSSLASPKFVSAGHTNNFVALLAAAQRFRSIKAETFLQSCSVKLPKTSVSYLMSFSRKDTPPRRSSGTRKSAPPLFYIKGHHHDPQFALLFTDITGRSVATVRYHLPCRDSPGCVHHSRRACPEAERAQPPDHYRCPHAR